MSERRTRRTVSAAMQWVLELLNADFRSGNAIPAFVSDEARRVEAGRFQNWLSHHLAPILVTDPDQVAEQRCSTLGALLRHAERRDRPVKELDALRHRLAQVPRKLDATLQREREDGLRQLAILLSEWAERAQIHPQWQVNELGPDQLSQVPAEQRYRCGAKVFGVSQWLPIPSSLIASGMMCVGACLVAGELTRLRACVECGRYFYAGDFRRISCGPVCYRRRDQARAVSRMKRWRRNKRIIIGASLKEYALVTLPKLSIRTLRALVEQRALNENAIDVLEGLWEKVAAGISPERIWKSTGARTRALFKRLQMTRAV